MPQYNFGVGQLALIPTGSNPTPVPFAVLTDISVDISYDLKELRGSYQFPIDVAKANAKLTGKAKNAGILGSLLGAVMSSSTSATGQILGAAGEAWTIPATPFQVTVTNSATFSVDLGVANLTSGKIMTRVASSPATGQYSVAAGVYTFAAADTTNNLAVSYAYTATTGATRTLSNALMGTSTPFQMHCYNVYSNNGVSKAFGLKLYSVHVPKIGFGLKAEAYTEQDLDFTAVQDSASLKVAEFYTYE